MTAATESLRRLAIPRLCGTTGAALVGQIVRDRLRALGYTVEEQRFTFSGWPVRHGVRIVGVIAAIANATAALLIFTGHAPWAVFLMLTAGIVALAFLVALGEMITHMRWNRMTGVNLWATAGPAPRFLVVAHRDSKSQSIPLGLRIAAAIIVIAAAALLLAAALGTIQPRPTIVIAGGVAGMLAGAVLACCGVGNSSDGALDNASGLATLLEVAAREQGAADVAFLVTDGEEFGLAGARAAARGHPYLASIEAVINFDGVDDRGGFFVLERRIPRGHLAGLSAAVFDAARSHGQSVRFRPVPPGLMLDHVPFLRRGIPALTLMHGGLLSLARVHRPSDSMARLRGQGIAITAAVTCEALRRLRAHEPARQPAGLHLH